MIARHCTRTLLSLLVLAGLVGSAGAEPSRTIREMGPVRIGQACPSFGGMTLDNQTLSLKRLLMPSGQAPAVVVISFFATWCQACKAHLPAIDRIVSGSKDVRGVLIDYGEDPDVVAPFAQAQKLRLPIIADKFAKIAARLGVSKALPRTIVVDAQGTVSTIFEIEGDDFDTALRAAIDQARGAK